MNSISKISPPRISSPFLAGLVYAVLWLVVGVLAASLLLLLTDMQESALTMYSFIIHGVAIFLGGMVSGKRAGNKGWYHGGLLGLLYGLIVAIVGFLAFDAGIKVQTPVLVTFCFLLGSLGGMLGVNLKK
jgi:putative membrane protein (TIGR04086 family)